MPAELPFSRYMDVIFLVYGLAFLSLGLIVVLRNERGSTLKLSRILWLLAAFGFSHGFLEWMDLWRVVRGDTAGLAATRPFVLLVSYLLLFEFGRRMVRTSLSAATQASRVGRLLDPWIHLPVLLVIVAAVAGADQPLTALTIWSRYLPGFLGSCLAGVGCYLYCHNRIGEDAATSEFPGLNGACYVAAAAFVAYGIFGGLVGVRADWSPAAEINEDSFQAAFLVPVQLLRAGCAVLIAASVGRLLRIFGRERQLKLRYVLDAGQYSLAQFHEIKSRYDAILDSATDGIVGLDNEGNSTFANAVALGMLGYRKDELIGKPFHALSHHTTVVGKPYAIADCPVHETILDGVTRRVNADLFWRKNRTWFPVAYQAVPLRRGERICGALILFRNLAELG